MLQGADGASDGILAELHRSLSSEDQTLLVEATCATDVPCGPFRSIVTQIAGAVEACDSATAVLATRLLEERGEAASASGELLRVVRARDGRLNVLESVRRLLCEAASRRGIIVALHDVHQADDDTLALIDYLLDDVSQARGVVGIGRANASRPSFVLCVSNDDPSGRRILRRMADRDCVDTVTVEPLDGPGLAAAISTPELSSRLVGLTGGLPHRLSLLMDLLPSSIEELVELRVGALSEEALRALRLMAVFGAPMGAGAVAVLSQVPRSVVESLRADRVLRDHGAGTDPMVELAAPFAASAAVVSMPDEERVALNDRCADYLVRRQALEGDPSLHEPICRHLLAAGAYGVAVEHALEAARWLRAGASPRRGVALLEHVARTAGGHWPDLELALIDGETALGQYESALARCRTLADSEHPTLAFRAARIHVLSEDLGTAEAALDSLLENTLPEPMRAAATAELAEVKLRRGDLDGAQALATERIAPTGAIKGLPALSLRHTQAKVAFWRADWASAEALYSAVLDDVPTSERRLRAMLLFNLGLVSLRTARYVEAGRRIEEALGLFEAGGDYYESAVCRHNLGITQEYRQRYAMARQLFESSIELFDRYGRRANLAGAVNSLGDLYLTVGEVWRSRKLLEHSLELARENGLTYLESFNRMRLAQLDLLDGCTDAAREHALAAVSSFAELGHAQELREAQLTVARVAFAAGDISAATVALEAATATAEADEAAARAAILGARIALHSGAAPATAHRQALSAAASLQALGQRDGVVSALTVAALAARSGGQNDEADALLARARDVLDDLRGRVPAEHREAFALLPVVTELVAAGTAPAPEAVPVAPKTAASRRRPAKPQASTQRLGIVGRSPEMLRVFDMIERLGNCEAPILIVGESGTGKELAAEAICASSSRAGKPFIRVNAAAFADTLLESELFGHEKGAFTGAISRKLGAFEQADGGTLFLDEIGDISPKTQVSLLRVLQEREFRRVGGRKPIRVDVRILCATNRNLEEMVQRGEFRLDLYYRVKGLTVDLPPLRDRPGDLELLAEHVLSGLTRKHGRQLSLAPDALRLLKSYRWPGNVRELENVLRSVFFFAVGAEVTADELTTYTLLRDAKPQDLNALCSSAPMDGPLAEGFDLNEAKRALEIQCIQKALDQTDGNITRAAKLLGMKRPRLSQKVKEYRLKSR